MRLVDELGASGIDYLRPGWPDQVRKLLDGRPVTHVRRCGRCGRSRDAGAARIRRPSGAVRHASGAPVELPATDLLRLCVTVSAAVGPRLVHRPGGQRPLEARALAQAAAGRLVPVIGQRYALADAAAAHEAVESHATTGKTVLHP